MARWFFRSLKDMPEKFPDLLFDGGQTLAAVENFYARRFLPGQREITLPDAVIKIERLIFHPVEKFTAASAFEADTRIEINDEREVGTAIADGEFIDELDPRRIELASGALIDSGRIKKTVGNYDLASGQGRLDDFPDELGAAGAK